MILVTEGDRLPALIEAGALFVANHSGGKDSQAMLIRLLEVVPAARVLVVHASLGEMEWPGALEHAKRQAAAAGLPFLVARTWTDNARGSVAGRQWYDWLPIHHLSTAEVFATILDAGQEPHPAYAAGNERLSCVFCILGSGRDARNGAIHHPDLFARYVELEARAGYTAHQSRKGLEEVAGLPPDSVCPDMEDFAFLGANRRIKVKRLRGVISMGLLVPAPEGSQVGDDVAEILGVTHYDPPLPLSTGGEGEKPPPGYRPVYDVESLRRYASAFVPGEPVFVTEKIHGANGRFTCIDGRMHCGSRTEWKKADEGNLWWRALAENSPLALFLQAHPDITVYAEVYGQVQDLKYGAGRGEVRVAVFDLLQAGEWLSPREARELAPDLPWVPTIADGAPFDLEEILALAEGPSQVPGAGHLREGIVVKPLIERSCLEVGRVNMKVVGNGSRRHEIPGLQSRLRDLRAGRRHLRRASLPAIGRACPLRGGRSLRRPRDGFCSRHFRLRARRLVDPPAVALRSPRRRSGYRLRSRLAGSRVCPGMGPRVMRPLRSPRSCPRPVPLPRLDPEQQQIVDLLRERGPLTAWQIAEIVYPDGRFREDWDLAPTEKAEMELGRCGFAVEVIGQGPGDSDPELAAIYGPADLYAATTSPERSEQLHREARSRRAAWMREMRAATRQGTEVAFPSRVAWDLYLEQRAEERRTAKFSPREFSIEFNAKLQEGRAALAELINDEERRLAFRANGRRS